METFELPEEKEKDMKLELYDHQKRIVSLNPKKYLIAHIVFTFDKTI